MADYERVGGIEGSIGASADRAYATLPPRRQEIAREVFSRLTAVSADGTDTAGTSTRAELAEGKTPAEAADVDAVLEAFAAERLLTLTAQSVEIGHEALLTAWPLLRDTWLAETRADRIVRAQLRTAAADWAGHDRDPAYLYRGNLLDAAEGTAARIRTDPVRNPPLGQAERDFLHASHRFRRRAVRWRRTAIAGLTALTLIASTVAVTAFHIAGVAARNAAYAAQQHAIALSRQFAAESLAADPADPLTARQLAIVAWRVSHTSQAESAMTTLVTEQWQEVPAERPRGQQR